MHAFIAGDHARLTQPYAAEMFGRAAARLNVPTVRLGRCPGFTLMRAYSVASLKREVILLRLITPRLS